MSQGPATVSRLGTAVSVFSWSFSLFYAVCDVFRWPVFSYYPATGLMAWGWAPDTNDDGPAMYWYGWVLSSLLGATLAGVIAANLPGPVRRGLSLHLAWMIPLIMVPVMAYTLRVYWR